MAFAHRNRFFLLLFITSLVGVGMLYFGIRLKGFRPDNHAQWLDTGPGLQFSRYGIAYTEHFFSPPGHRAGLTIEMVIEPELSQYPDFRFILVVHGGADARQLVVGQWRSTLIVMNGNDYDGKKGIPKAGIDLGPQVQEPHLVTITSNETGTQVYLDGCLVKRHPKLHLVYPDRTGSTRLVVGNSIYARNPWSGKMLGLAFYDRVLSEQAIQAHFENWKKERTLSAAAAEAPNILYVFAEGSGERVRNIAGNAFDLLVPEYMTILQKEILGLPEKDTLNWNLFQDMVLNFFGFIPLGLLLCATLNQTQGFFRRYGWQSAVALAFLFSFGLELAQAWMPSRTSSMLDLLLNTGGGGLGATICVYLKHRFRPA